MTSPRHSKVCAFVCCPGRQKRGNATEHAKQPSVVTRNPQYQQFITCPLQINVSSKMMTPAERSARIHRQMEILLVGGYRCFSQAFCQAERIIDNKRRFQEPELNKIKAKCEDECCKPCADEEHWYVAWRLKYERERLPKHDKEAERRRIPFACQERTRRRE